MDIRLEATEHIKISIKGVPDVVYHLSAESIKEMGKRVVDGLSPEELALLRDKKTFYAVRHLRSRTGVSFKAAKEVVDAYRKKHGCCEKWPMCDAKHKTGIEGLDVALLSHVRFGSKATMFTYQGRVAVEDAHKLQEWAGFPIEVFGFFSFYACDDASKWSCKCKQKEPSIK